MPMRHVVTQERALRATVDLDQTAQTKLSVDESCVDLLVDVLHVELLDEGPPYRPLYFCRKQVLLFSKKKSLS